MHIPDNATAEISAYFLNLQALICQSLEKHEGQNSFKANPWESKLGKGISMIIENGQVFAKGGVNFSDVKGQTLPAAATLKRPELAGGEFNAMGISLVMHPLNPYVPTTHANLRFISAKNKDKKLTWWFGGGFDLTPYYGFEEDCIHWHKTAKAACSSFGEELYPRFKAWCDEYFFLPHRQEARGIGGIFFDDFQRENFAKSFAFIQSVGNYTRCFGRIIFGRYHSSAYGVYETRANPKSFSGSLRSYGYLYGSGP